MADEESDVPTAEDAAEESEVATGEEPDAAGDEPAGEGDEEYGIAEVVDLEEVAAPDLPYQPRDPESYDPGIALVGVGGISEQHLRAYTDAGYDVVALCDHTREKAVRRREEFDLDADVYTDYREVLDRDDVAVVDLLPHPVDREPLIEDAIRAGKHVLSQKPFVVDLDLGERLVEMADDAGVKLAVNQNGRWAPHWSYARHAVAEGLLGRPHGVHFAVDWNHNWIADTEIDDVEHAILYDFAVHWFDVLSTLVDDEPRRVYASYEPSPAQEATPPLLASAVVEFDGAQAVYSFDADTRLGPEDRTTVVGTEGTLRCEGPDLEEQTVTLYTEEGYAVPDLEGTWFPDGFHGTMAELLSAIEEGREPENSGRDNLETLALTFAAVASAEDGEPKVPGEVRELRGVGE